LLIACQVFFGKARGAEDLQHLGWRRAAENEVPFKGAVAREVCGRVLPSTGFPHRSAGAKEAQEEWDAEEQSQHAQRASLPQGKVPGWALILHIALIWHR